MGNNKGSGIFLGVIGVATLIVAIIGATFAFFGANISSGEGVVTATAATLSLGYSDVVTGLKKNMIPAEYWIAEYAANEQLSQAEIDAEKTEDENFTYDGNLQCMDDNGNEVCGVYTFTIGNPSFTTSQDLYGSVKVVSNEIADLYFSIYDENGNQVVEPTAFAEADETTGLIDLPELNQKLLASTADADKDGDGTSDTAGFNAEDPTTYTTVTDTVTEKVDGEDVTITRYNRRTYKMVIWIEETMKDQTSTSGNGRAFTGSITFTTANDRSGVTGVIVGAQREENATDNPDGSNYTDEGYYPAEDAGA